MEHPSPEDEPTSLDAAVHLIEGLAEVSKKTFGQDRQHAEQIDLLLEVLRKFLKQKGSVGLRTKILNFLKESADKLAEAVGNGRSALDTVARSIAQEPMSTEVAAGLTPQIDDFLWEIRRCASIHLLARAGHCVSIERLDAIGPELATCKKRFDDWSRQKDEYIWDTTSTELAFYKNALHVSHGDELEFMRYAAALRSELSKPEPSIESLPLPVSNLIRQIQNQNSNGDADSGNEDANSGEEGDGDGNEDEEEEDGLEPGASDEGDMIPWVAHPKPALKGFTQLTRDLNKQKKAEATQSDKVRSIGKVVAQSKKSEKSDSGIDTTLRQKLSSLEEENRRLRKKQKDKELSRDEDESTDEELRIARNECTEKDKGAGAHAKVYLLEARYLPKLKRALLERVKVRAAFVSRNLPQYLKNLAPIYAYGLVLIEVPWLDDGLVAFILADLEKYKGTHIVLQWRHASLKFQTSRSDQARDYSILCKEIEDKHTIHRADAQRGVYRTLVEFVVLWIVYNFDKNTLRVIDWVSIFMYGTEAAQDLDALQKLANERELKTAEHKARVFELSDARSKTLRLLDPEVAAGATYVTRLQMEEDTESAIEAKQQEEAEKKLAEREADLDAREQAIAAREAQYRLVEKSHDNLASDESGQKNSNGSGRGRGSWGRAQYRMRKQGNAAKRNDQKKFNDGQPKKQHQPEKKPDEAADN